jgi:hypothetical protein
MAYTPTNWQDRVSSNPGQFTVAGAVNGDITLTLNDNPTTDGTPIKAANMNNIENELVFLDGLNYKGFAKDEGTAANTYVVNLSPAITSLEAGQVIIFMPSYNSTGPSTLNVNGLGAKTIAKPGFVNALTNIGSGDVMQFCPAMVVFDGNYWELLNSHHAIRQIVFTSTTSFVIPLGVSYMYAEVIGGGGGGAGGTGGGYYDGAAGGGGGGYVAGWMSVTPGNTLSITVGAGGSGGTGGTSGNGTAGNDGGPSSCGSFLAWGGSGSTPGAASNSSPGVGGNGGTGIVLVSGQNGSGCNGTYGGAGGNAANGIYTYGQGGTGGSGSTSDVGTNGTSGSSGAVILYW